MISPLYFDYAAATPLDERVRAAMEPFFQEVFYNPSALYGGGLAAKEALEKARSTVARTIGAKPSEIIFTAGGSESANAAIHGVMNLYHGKQVLISAIEHEAVRKSAERHACVQVPVLPSGIVDVQQLKAQITDDTVLISVLLVNNEIGTLQPVQEIAQVVQHIRDSRKRQGNSTPLLLHTDACQAPLYVDCSIARLGVDLMTLNGGKLYGPKQSGILYVRSGVRLQPLIDGGGQEFGVRSGTENVAFAIGFVTALELAQKGRQERAKKMTELRDYAIARLIAECGAELSGHPTKRVANNVHVTFEGKDNERILFALDELGVAVATGSACSASSDEPSSVLQALGYSPEKARSSIRLTFGRYTTKEAIDSLVEKMKIALNA